MKVLVSILPFASKESAQKVSPQVARLDRFSNGLLSRAIHQGVFQTPVQGKKSVKIDPWCFLRPRFQNCGAVMLWTSDAKIDWDSLLLVHPNADFLLDSEVFTDSDLQKVQSATSESRARLWPKKGDVD
jgi:hypothetical protein